MKWRICKSGVVEELRRNIDNNIDVYRSGDFSFLVSDSASFIELDIEIEELKIQALGQDLQDLIDSYQSEVSCAMVVFDALNSITPYLARDERMWVYMTHTIGLEYSRRRWPIPEDEESAGKHIRTHFFASSARQVERDNAISRLWWVAHLCSRAEDLNLRDALDAFLYRADVRANIVERPTTSQSLRTFSAILTRLHSSLEGTKELFERDRFRRSMVDLNLLGGIVLLEALPRLELEKILAKSIDQLDDA